MWLKYNSGVINLDKISSIETRTVIDGIVVLINVPPDPLSIYVTTLSTRAKAQKFLSKISDYMNQGMKCIDVDVIATQVENECQT